MEARSLRSSSEPSLGCSEAEAEEGVIRRAYLWLTCSVLKEKKPTIDTALRY